MTMRNDAAKTGDTVRVHYTGTLADGRVFDSSAGSDPIEFTVGAGRVLPGFENAVVGMTTGDEKTATIPAGDAYGEHDPGLVQQVERGILPDDIEIEEGIRLRAQSDDGVVDFIVTDVGPSIVTLDANHPLAGEDLTFQIELAEILGAD